MKEEESILNKNIEELKKNENKIKQLITERNKELDNTDKALDLNKLKKAQLNEEIKTIKSSLEHNKEINNELIAHYKNQKEMIGNIFDETLIETKNAKEELKKLQENIKSSTIERNNIANYTKKQVENDTADLNRIKIETSKIGSIKQGIAKLRESLTNLQRDMLKKGFQQDTISSNITNFITILGQISSIINSTTSPASIPVIPQRGHY